MENMPYIKCPHCATVTEYGVNICIGCKAEVRYGPESGEVNLVGFVCGVLAFVGSAFLVFISPFRNSPQAVWFFIVPATIICVAWATGAYKRKHMTRVKFYR